MKNIGKKLIKLQDAKYKLNVNGSNEASIFIENELANKLNIQNDVEINFNIDKIDVLKLLTFTFSFSKPIYGQKTTIAFDEIWFNKKLELINKHFLKGNTFIFKGKEQGGNRKYLISLAQSEGLNLRDLFIENHVILLFEKDEDTNDIWIRIKTYSNEISDDSDDSEDFTIKASVSQDVNNVIYYGSPGTGKSHRADLETNGKDVQKVTFHPDYDYHSFVGGYKPTMDGDKIAYKFVPQIFTKIYVNAWKNFASADETKLFYLQIEEINRGNCAEIFGDLFQLLDRKSDGSSKYEVTAEEELYKYLLSADGFGEEHDGIKGGKLSFPSNLKIIATMNTSDQSLFPMDSAFKRRWDWIYVPIDTDCKFSDFTIKLDNGKAFEWLSFLKIINEEIFEITKSQDKQIGNWFIDAQNTGKVISESTFVNKVIFYLWNDVFKDEENTIFKSADGKNLTYTSFFENGSSNNLISYILEERLKLTDFNKAETNTTDTE
jgi:hypothetical protein